MSIRRSWPSAVAEVCRTLAGPLQQGIAVAVTSTKEPKQKPRRLLLERFHARPRHRRPPGGFSSRSAWWRARAQEPCQSRRKEAEVRLPPPPMLQSRSQKAGAVPAWRMPPLAWLQSKRWLPKAVLVARLPPLAKLQSQTWHARAMPVVRLPPLAKSRSWKPGCLPAVGMPPPVQGQFPMTKQRRIPTPRCRRPASLEMEPLREQTLADLMEHWVQAKRVKTEEPGPEPHMACLKQANQRHPKSARHWLSAEAFPFR